MGKTMNDKVVDAIAKNNTEGQIWTWVENIAASQHNVFTGANATIRKVCDECPFRNNKAMGGCITTACPIHKVSDAILALGDKARAIGRKASNRLCQFLLQEWEANRNNN